MLLCFSAISYDKGVVVEEMRSNINNSSILQIQYFQIVDIWQRLCEEHSRLLDVTCDEYAKLLESNIEELEVVIKHKENVIRTINNLETLRVEIIKEINEKNVFDKKIENVSDLIIVMRDFEDKNEQKHLFRFNQLLIDLIEKIQEQNKKNQLFLNKAILSLRQIRDEASGHKSFMTYNEKGLTKKHVVS